MLAYSPPDARLTVNACRRRGGAPRRTWRFSGGRDSETGSGSGPMWRTSERWRSGWDGEFESPLLQRRVGCELPGDGNQVDREAFVDQNHADGRLGEIERESLR